MDRSDRSKDHIFILQKIFIIGTTANPNCLMLDSLSFIQDGAYHLVTLVRKKVRIGRKFYQN